MNWTGKLALFLLVFVTASGCVQTRPLMSHSHIGHAMTTWHDMPGQQGLYTVAANEPDIAIGNVIGSNMFNLLAVLGIPGIIHPTVLEPEVLNRDYFYMIGLSIALFVMAYGFRGQGRINRVEGLLLLIAYVVYLGLLYHSVAS